ncbi:MAG: RluA family pseudouridine synthase [Armatimonadetes bacterium]|nr:RluA family pseudouridine synthase [Candidatus Hippobium faecium]
MKFEYKEEKSERLDVFLASHLEDMSRSSVQKLAEKGQVKVNGKRAKSNYKLSFGDEIDIEYTETAPASVEAENIPLDIVYEDDDLLVVNKPKGMSVHPAPGTPNHTLVNALLCHCEFLSEIGGEERPGIVHRLDKNTSGLLVVAKNNKVHRLLQTSIQKREVSRKYKALVWGVTDFEEAKVDMPIGRDPKDRKKQAVIDDEDLTRREAVTYLNVIKRYAHFTFLECRLETGRTHQIRVHLSYIGYPVVGDEEYKGAKRKFGFSYGRKGDEELRKLLDECQGQLLHAYELSFVHPITGEFLKFTAPLPENYENMLRFLDKTE